MGILEAPDPRLDFAVSKAIGSKWVVFDLGSDAACLRGSIPSWQTEDRRQDVRNRDRVLEGSPAELPNHTSED
jgi:hypothetical protein